MMREARSAPEFAVVFAMAAGPLLATLPRGDGHAVLVLPGLGGSDASTAPLRWFLGRLGYTTAGWGRGRNLGFGRHVSDGLDALLAAKREIGDVSLVGWSLGGVHAVQLARRRPDAVRGRHVGQPARRPLPAAAGDSHHVGVQPHRCHRRAALGAPGARRVHENVEVHGSHLGLGHNPSVALVVADRLAQQPATWEPFTAPRWARAWLPAA